MTKPSNGHHFHSLTPLLDTVHRGFHSLLLDHEEERKKPLSLSLSVNKCQKRKRKRKIMSTSALLFSTISCLLLLLCFLGSVECYKNCTAGDYLGWFDKLEKPNVNYQKKNVFEGQYTEEFFNPIFETWQAGETGWEYMDVEP